MGNGGEREKEKELYEIMGLNKDCSQSELRNAYKKLALKWHPDRWSGNSNLVQEANKKFKAIHQAYSVLSDTNKRLMYDLGVYDSDDDENGMDDFLNEMAAMMSQTKTNENEESLEELQKLFEEIFEADFVSSNSSTYMTYTSTSTSSNNSNSSQINIIGKPDQSFHLDSTYHNFCLGSDGGDSRDEKGKKVGGSSNRPSRQITPNQTNWTPDSM